MKPKGLFKVEVQLFSEAVLDDRLFQGAAEILLQAHACAEKRGRRRDCFVCGRRWTKRRSPLLFISIEALKADQLACGLICAECSMSKDMKPRLLAVLGKHYGMNVDDVRHIHEAHHA